MVRRRPDRPRHEMTSRQVRPRSCRQRTRNTYGARRRKASQPKEGPTTGKRRWPKVSPQAARGEMVFRTAKRPSERTGDSPSTWAQNRETVPPKGLHREMGQVQYCSGQARSPLNARVFGGHMECSA